MDCNSRRGNFPDNFSDDLPDGLERLAQNPVPGGAAGPAELAGAGVGAGGAGAKPGHRDQSRGS